MFTHKEIGENRKAYHVTDRRTDRYRWLTPELTNIIYTKTYYKVKSAFISRKGCLFDKKLTTLCRDSIFCAIT